MTQHHLLVLIKQHSGYLFDTKKTHPLASTIMRTVTRTHLFYALRRLATTKAITAVILQLAVMLCESYQLPSTSAIDLTFLQPTERLIAMVSSQDELDGFKLFSEYAKHIHCYGGLTYR